MTTIDQRDLDLCTVQKSEEWEVLSSIYPDCVSRDSPNGVLKLEIPVEPQNPINVFVTASGTGEVQEHHLSLSSLPPLFLEVVLPPAYPLYAAPEISSFHVSGSWIPRIGLVLESLLEMWHPGEAILYTWVEWIRSAEFLNSLQLMHNDVLRIPNAAPQLLLPFLTAHESKSQSSKFNQLSHSCSVCFETRKGSQCLQLYCGHVFCRACLRDGWSLYIAEGDVAHVGCLSPQCVKDGREATEDEVRRVVTEEEVRRWKWLREKKASERGEFTAYKYLNAHDLQTLRLCYVPCPCVKHLFPNRREPKFMTEPGGKGYELAMYVTILSAHFVREHGTGRYQIAPSRSQRSSSSSTWRRQKGRLCEKRWSGGTGRRI